jgi:hypothetical protein
MKQSYRIKNILKTAMAAGLTFLASHALSQVSLSGGAYTQNFNSLPSTVGNNPWTNNTTLPGWYAEAVLSPAIWGVGGEATNIIANSGAGTAAGFYSLGTNGVNPVTDRALGSIGGNTLAASGAPAIAYGVRMTNDTGVALTNFVISYTGKQWRDSGNLTAQTIAFGYRIDSQAITNADPSSTATWTPATTLNFTSPIHSGTATALDGNATANKSNFTAVTLSGFVVLSGQEIFFRWLDINDSGNDHVLSVDDLSISFDTNNNAVISGPTISAGPTNLTIPEGNTATFAVTAGGSQPLFFQWYQTNTDTTVVPVTGATGATFTTNFVPVSLSGSGYFVVVTNAAPSANVITSSVAVLTVTNAVPVVTNIAYLHTLHNANFALTDTNTLYQVEGIVTTSGDMVSSGGQSTYFQDDSGSGMDLFFFTGTGGFSLPSIGDRIRVTGQLSQFQGALEIQLTANPAHKLEVLSSGNTLPTPRFFNFSAGIDPNVMEGYVTNGTTAIPAVEGSYVIISNVFLGITNTGGAVLPDQTIFATNLTGQKFFLRVPNNPAAQTVLTSLPGTFATSVKGVMSQFQTTGTVLTNLYAMYYDLQSNIEVGNPPVILIQPKINSIAITPDGIVISGTNNNGTASGNYAVLASTNVTLPLSSWTALSTQAFNPDGTLSVTNALGTESQRFYLLQVLP